MILFISLICALVGIGYSLTAKKIFEKGLSESDSYRMVMEFNKSKRVRKYSTVFLLSAIILFIIYVFQIVINYNTK